ncbi:sensor histidine kinase [Campylobacter sp.]|uniref:sensor histidine kinase n=1 Tax=Campylobacter sp. TaxID=205 RepID=UPI00270CE897|nr:HAMP domain-containing sensor histidine kinase [Campylobacter sp.]
MLSKNRNFIFLFCLLFAVCITIIKLLENIYVSAFLISSIFIAFLFFMIRKDTAKLNLYIENLKSSNSLQDEQKKMFFSQSAKLQETIDELKEELKKKSKKSIKKSAKIKLRNTQLQGILSSISHEFKNPIAIIEASSHTLLKDKDLSNEMRDKFIEKITRNSQKIVNLIDRLNLKSTESLQINLSDFSLNALANEVKNELLERYKDRDISVQEAKIFIRADEALIKQVLINLVENALKYSQGKVEIYFEKGAVFIRDSGAGIEQKDLKLVTKKYFKTQNNIQTNSFGLGLYISKQILKMHGFELFISSQVGKGSVFGFCYVQKDDKERKQG